MNQFLPNLDCGVFFFIMLYRNMVFKTLKCKKKICDVITSVLYRCWKWSMDLSLHIHVRDKPLCISVLLSANLSVFVSQVVSLWRDPRIYHCMYITESSFLVYICLSFCLSVFVSWVVGLWRDQWIYHCKFMSGPSLMLYIYLSFSLSVFVSQVLIF